MTFHYDVRRDLVETIYGIVMYSKGKAIPVQDLRVPGSQGSQISRQSVHEGGKFVSPTHRPPLTPRKYS